MSGAHRVPPWARVEIKLKMSFQALSHSPSHERASALTSPPPDFLFIAIPQCPQPHHPKNSNIPYWSCLPSPGTVSLPLSSLKCLQNTNPNIHTKCFKCFRCSECFRCFISLLDKKPPVFGPNRNKIGVSSVPSVPSVPPLQASLTRHFAISNNFRKFAYHFQQFKFFQPQLISYEIKIYQFPTANVCISLGSNGTNLHHLLRQFSHPMGNRGHSLLV